MTPDPPILLPYQARWHEDKARVRVWAKSRRIGASWGGLACEAVLEAAAAEGMDQWYIGYEQEMTREFILDCAHFVRVFGIASGEFGESVVDDEGADILAFHIKFASGYRITALSSKPRNIRSKQGHVMLDEAAFVDDLAGFLKAALALTVWGGRVSIVSSHNGVDNPFNKLCEDILSGRDGKSSYSLHVTTFDDAIEDGLYERTCYVKGETPTAEGKIAWRNSIVDDYGEDAAEELFCIPNKSGGAYIPRPVVEACMFDAPVVRLDCEDDFTLRPENERTEWMEKWIAANVAPLLRLLDADAPSFYGQDFGRTSDLSVTAVSQLTSKMVLRVPFLIETRNVPFDQQRQLMLWLVQKLPNFTAGKIDSTGNGASHGEFAVQRFGARRFEAVQMSEKWYRENLPPFKAALEDRRAEIPRDRDVVQDLASLRVIDGVPKLPKAKTSTKVEQGRRVSRHGDAAIALALTHAASRVESLGAPVVESVYERPHQPVWEVNERPRFGGL